MTSYNSLLRSHLIVKILSALNDSFFYQINTKMELKKAKKDIVVVKTKIIVHT